MEAKAIAKTVRMSPRKARLVVDLVRGKSVGEALSILRLTANDASVAIEKTLRSAVANAVNNNQMDKDKLYVKEIYANEGIRMKRYLPRAKGSADPILKRTTHITVVVAERE